MARRRKRAASIASIAAHSLLRSDAVDENELAWRIIEIAYGSDNAGGVGERVDDILRRLE